MATITTRAGKGSPLTNTEVDDNFSNLNSAKYESGSNVSFGTISSGVQTIQGNFESDYAIKFDNTKGTGAEWGWRSHGVNGERFAFYDVSSGEQYMAFSNSSAEGVIFNENSLDQDFRVESNDNSHMLFVDASTNRLGVGTGTPLGDVQIVTATAGTVLNVNHNTGGSYPKASGIGLGATSTALTVASDGGTVSFTGGAGIYAENTAASGNPTNLVFWTNLSGTPAQVLSIGGNKVATFAGDVTLAAGKSLTLTSGMLEMPTNYKVRWGGRNNYSVFSDNANYVIVKAADQEAARFGNTESVFNDGSDDRDFRVESDVDSHALFVNGENSKVGIRNNNPNYLLDVSGNASFPLGVRYIQSLQDVTDTSEQIGVRVQHNRYEQSGNTMDAQGNHAGFEYALTTGGSANATISGDTYGAKVTRSMGSGGNTTGTNYGYYYNSATYGSSGGVTYAFYADNVAPNSNGGRYAFYNNDASATSVFNGPNIFNETSNDVDFRVESDSNTHMVFVDGGSNHVNIGTSTDYGGTLNLHDSIYSAETDTPRIRLRNIGNSDTEIGVNGLSAGLDTFYIAQYNGIAANEWDFRLTGASREFAFIRGGVVNEGAGDSDFRVETGATSNGLLVDGGSDRVITQTSGGFTAEFGGAFNYTGFTVRNTGTASSSAHKAQINFDVHGSGGNANRANVVAGKVGSGSTEGFLRFDVQRSGTLETKLSLRPAEIVVNEESYDNDFRVESDGNANMLHVDGGNNSVGIGTTGGTTGSLVVQANSGAGGISVVGRSNGGIGGLSFYDDNGSTSVGYIQGRADDTQMRMWGTQSGGNVSFAQNNTERLRITSYGGTHARNGHLGSSYTYADNPDRVYWTLSTFNDNARVTSGTVSIYTSNVEWQPNLIRVVATSVDSDLTDTGNAVWYIRVSSYHGAGSGISIVESWTSGNMAISVTATDINQHHMRVNITVTGSGNRTVCAAESLSYGGVFETARTG
jgi:hypothetical protein